MRNWQFFFGIGILLCSCNLADDRLEQTLSEAGDNRRELEKVLNHYTGNDSDPEKYEAARFLIENMSDKFAYQGKAYAQFLNFVDSINDVSVSINDWKGAIASYCATHNTLVGYPDKVFDVTDITSDFLIKNIDQAFFVYRNASWCKDVPFEDFCEYILPYRYGNEPLEDFRTKSLKQFGHLISDKTLSPRQVADSILRATSKHEVEITTFPSFVPEFPFATLSRIKGGRCDDFVALAIMVMRSLGLCVAQDFTPQWPHRAMGHSWGVLLLPDGSYVDFEGANSHKLGGHLKYPSFRMAKAFRRIYGKAERFLIRESNGETIPDFFLNPNTVDVSSHYLGDTDIVVEIPEEHQGKAEYAYICVFDNKNWIPIHWGKIHGNRVVFSDMGRQVVYLTVLYQSHKIIPIVPPLLLDSNGTTRSLVPSRELLETVHLTRKYPVFDWWNTRTQALKGGKFQAANNAGFSPAHDLYVIDSVPQMTYHDILIDTSKRYRYFRYLAPDSTQGDIAEIETYDENGQTLAGTVIGTTVGDSNPNTGERAFDGEALTYFQGDSTHNNWVGLAFESPKSIKKIRFLCRNDDNFIKFGELYQLLYWEDNRWKPLESKRGQVSKFLTFENVPKGSLLLLRNLTKGREERPFTYIDGKQVWW